MKHIAEFVGVLRDAGFAPSRVYVHPQTVVDLYGGPLAFESECRQLGIELHYSRKVTWGEVLIDDEPVGDAVA